MNFDPRDAFGGVRVQVTIQTPAVYDPRLRGVRPAQHFGFDSSDADADPDLVHVSVTKSISAPCGSFSLSFAPRLLSRSPDTYWNDVIPPYSLVEIRMQRYPRDRAPVLVCLGLTDGDQFTGNFGLKDPQRSVTVSGREVSCVFVDQHTLYLPTGPEAVDPAVVSSAEWSKEGLPPLPPILDSATQLLGLVAVDPELAEQGANPTQVIERFIQMMTTGYRSQWNMQGVPLLQLQLADPIDNPRGSDLKDLLVYSPGALFDARAILPSSSQSVTNNSPLWSLMSTWCDPSYMELFARSVLRNGRSAVEIVFRKKPFGGRLDEQGNYVGVCNAVGTQFDADFAADDSQNFTIEDTDVLSVTLRRDLSRAVNLYRVWPQTLYGNDPEELATQLTPLLDAGDEAPSAMRRIGLRCMDVSDYYFKDILTAETTEQARQRAKLLWYWHRFEPLFKHGRYITSLVPTGNIGMRMVHAGAGPGGVNLDTEYYVTGVSHTCAFGPEVTANSAFEVSRGWPL